MRVTPKIYNNFCWQNIYCKLKKTACKKLINFRYFYRAMPASPCCKYPKRKSIMLQHIMKRSTSRFQFRTVRKEVSVCYKKLALIAESEY